MSDQLRKDLFKIACEHPETRKHIVPLLKKGKTAAGGALESYLNKAFMAWAKKIGKAASAGHVDTSSVSQNEVEIGFPGIPDRPDSFTILYLEPVWDRGYVTMRAYILIEDGNLGDFETRSQTLSFGDILHLTPSGLRKMVGSIVKKESGYR